MINLPDLLVTTCHSGQSVIVPNQDKSDELLYFCSGWAGCKRLDACEMGSIVQQSKLLCLMNMFFVKLIKN